MIQKIQIAYTYNEAANTDIYKVFMLILDTALEHHMSQEELPKNIIIISDMEFDSCAENNNETMFGKIAYQYKKYGRTSSAKINFLECKQQNKYNTSKREFFRSSVGKWIFYSHFEYGNVQTVNDLFADIGKWLALVFIILLLASPIFIMI